MQITKLIPIAAAHEFIGLRKTAVYDLIKTGKIQATKIGAKTFIDEAEIARYREKAAVKIGRQDAPDKAA